MTSTSLEPEPSLAEAAYASLAQLNAAIEDLTDPWSRKMLTVWRDHFWGEVVGDLDAIMATLAPDPVYRFHGWLASGGSDTTEGARALYARLIDMGYRPAGALRKMKFAFADWGMTVQFTLTAIYPGSILPGDDIDPDADYRVTVSAMQSHPFDRNGLMGGEEVFMLEPSEIVRVER